MQTKNSAAGLMLTIVRLAVGGLFVFAAYNKLADPQGFVDSIKAFKILPAHLTILAAYVVPWIEMLAGAALIVGLWSRSAALVIALMLVAFIAGISSVIYRGLDVKCGCFGKFEIPCTGPVGMCHIARNSVLLLLTLAALTWGPGRFAIDARAATK